MAFVGITGWSTEGILFSSFLQQFLESSNLNLSYLNFHNVRSQKPCEELHFRVGATAQTQSRRLLQHNLISLSLQRILKPMRLLTSAFSFLAYLFVSFHEPNCKSLKSCSYVYLNLLNFGLDVNITFISMWFSWSQRSNWANSPHEAFGQPREDAGHTYNSISYVWATSECLEDQVPTQTESLCNIFFTT